MSATKLDDVDQENINQLGTACPVSDKHLLHSPPETREWVTLKEGYLVKTKFKKLHNSTKLRMFALKQNPSNFVSCLEYYEGLSYRGSASLANARIHPQKAGVFLVHTTDRTFHLQAEKGDLRVATSWVLALQQAILTAARAAKGSNPDLKPKSAAEPPSPKGFIAARCSPSPESSPAVSKQSSRTMVVDEMTAIPSAIDEARWAALRKTLNAGGAEVDPHDADVALLRAAEEEEERRQKAERAAWLNRLKKPELAAISEDAEEEEEGQGGESSDDEDLENELQIRLLRLAEEEEERRQEAERQEYLARMRAQAQ